MRKARAFLVCALAALLAGCEIEDELKIRADGSGTYHARVTVERLVSPLLARIRAEAEKEGFRIIEEGASLTHRFIVVRKDFTDVAALSGPQSNFHLQVDKPNFFRRRYRLHATVGSVSGASFERRFRITMPAEVTSTSAGNSEGRIVTWYCKNGGTIDVVAEGTHIPITRYHLLGALVCAMAAATLLVVAIVWRQRARAAHRQEEREEAEACTTCHKPMPAGSRYCPACGDRVLPPQRPSGFP